MSFGRERVTRENRLADTQILVNYRQSPWVSDSLPDDAVTLHAGDRAPDVLGLRREKVGFPLRLFDMLHGTAHILIVVVAAGAAAGAEDLQQLLADLQKEQEDTLRIVAIVDGDGGGPDIPGITVLLDPSRAFATSYGAEPGYVCLVRPDGYLAYVAEALRTEALRVAIGRSFGRGNG
jgi:Aromatic-ring hydroxylase, C-terminal